MVHATPRFLSPPLPPGRWVTVPVNALGTLPTELAAACRRATSDRDLFEQCRRVLATHFRSDHIWFAVHPRLGVPHFVGPTLDGAVAREEIVRSPTDRFEVQLLADPDTADLMRPVALPLSASLAVVLELHEWVVGNSAGAAGATAQLRALRQVTRLLSAIDSVERTSQLVVDFLTQVSGSAWGALYRRVGDRYQPDGVSAPHRAPPLPTLPPEVLEASYTRGTSEAGDRLPHASVIVPLEAAGERRGVLVLGPRVDEEKYAQADKALLDTLAIASAMALKNAELVDRLTNAATTDELTGLLNRRALEERLETEIDRSARHHLSVAIVLVDVDRLKQINDTLGHAAGDYLLRAVGEVLRREARGLDVVGRLGGDEFLVVLPMTTAREARVYVDRVKQGMREIDRRRPDLAPCRASMGIAQATQHGRNGSELLRAADAALYAGKRSGGDAVVTAGE